MSSVWEVFLKDKEKRIVKCNLCHSELGLMKDGGTSNMKKHIERRHPAKYVELFGGGKKRTPATSGGSSRTGDASGLGNNATKVINSNSTSTQPTIQNMLRRKEKLASTSSRAQALTDSIARLICLDLQPFSVTEDHGFKYLMSQAEPRYVVPSRASFRNLHLPRLYKTTLEKLKQEIAEHMATNGTVSITTDAWTSKTMTSYITYTLHFIRNDFTMAAYNIGTYEFSEAHTASNLKRHIHLALAECGVLENNNDGVPIQSPASRTSDDGDGEMSVDEPEIEDEEDNDQQSDEEDSDVDSGDDHGNTQIDLNIYITTDNAKNISKAVSESRFTHIRCFTHTINLGVQNGLKIRAITKQVSKVRNVLKYFRKSYKAKYALQVS